MRALGKVRIKLVVLEHQYSVRVYKFFFCVNVTAALATLSPVKDCLKLSFRLSTHCNPPASQTRS